MGVSCLQQHVWIRPRERAHRAPGNRSDHPAFTLRPSKRPFYPVFQPRSRTLSLRIPAHREKDARSSAHLPLKHTYNRRPAVRADRVLTRQEGRLQVRRAGTGSGSKGSPGSCCCLGAGTATGVVGSLSNWVEREAGPAHQHRPRWLFLFRGRDTALTPGRSFS